MRAEGQVVAAREAAAQAVGEAPPAALYVPDLACSPRIREKAVRQRVARAQLPRPSESEKRLQGRAKLLFSGCGIAAGRQDRPR